MDNAVKNISVTDTVIPKCNTDGNHKEHQNVFLYAIGNETYAYTIMSNDSFTAGELMDLTWEINGIHFWKYEGAKASEYVNDPTPNYSGKTFTYEGKEYKYNLMPFSKIYRGHIWGLAYELANDGTGTATDIREFDFNLNGQLDQNDIEIVLKHALTNPYYLLWDLRKEAVLSYFDNIPNLNHTNAVIYRTEETKPVEYAYCIPTGYLDPNFEGASSSYPVQILPVEDYDKVSSYKQDKFASDDEMEYIVWEPDVNRWAKGSYSNPINWVFRSGLYVYVLNDDGTPKLEWIK